ncbi:MAG: polysaccharide deacetylase family protein [Clostridia bacterium]|nr:polysaccharide deacetylase family protein [Clostridia bacterium]
MRTTTKLTALCAACLLAWPVSAKGIFDRLLPEETEELSEDVTPKRGEKSPLYSKKPDEPAEPEKSAPTAASMSYSWYFKKTDDGSRPPVPPEMSFITDCGGVFIGRDAKEICLTFDVGYENGNVAKILDVLKEENVPGAFFVLENVVTRNTELVQRMIDEGHTVANHTASHRDMSEITSKEEFAAELTKMEQIYRETTGCEMAKYYRPPEGRFSRDNLVWAQELGYKTVFWSFAYADWDNNSQMSPDAAESKVLAGTHNGEILLLHPTSATNAAILGDLIREWKAMGYTFVTLDTACGS